MGRIAIMILTIFPFVMLGQQTVQLTAVKEKTFDKEVYSVLKSDTTIKQGSYRLFTLGNELKQEGFYKNGQKDSSWTEYQWVGKNKVLKAKGCYQQDVKTGIWEFYNFKGLPEQRYDYSRKELTFCQPDDSLREYQLLLDTGTLKTKLDRPPVYIGGTATLLDEINLNIKYPDIAVENDIVGMVYIAFTIDKTGKTSNYRVLKGIGAGCNESALEAVKMIPECWLPGILQGKAVTVEYRLPIRFTIDAQ
jgi:TonB family protein